jgi:hypothetical protein
LPFAVGIVLAPADVDPHIAAVGLAKLLQALLERCGRGGDQAGGQLRAKRRHNLIRRLRSRVTRMPLFHETRIYEMAIPIPTFAEHGFSEPVRTAKPTSPCSTAAQMC